MIDIGEQFNLSNKLSHPSNESKIVYKHVKKEQSETFVELLVDAGIDFEVQIDEEDEKKPTYFGIMRRHETEVDQLNFTAIGKHRPRFIASAPVRWLFIVISGSMLLLALFGAWMSS